MKRKTDVSRLRPAPGQDAPETGTQPSSCDAAVERATALLVHSMQQSDSPISELGGALARMAQALSESGTPLFGGPAGEPAGDGQSLREALARDIAVCIQNLQFHDRLMQQLTQARDLLTGHAGNGLPRVLVRAPAGEAGIDGSVELF
jgi:hypothetical protein